MSVRRDGSAGEGSSSSGQDRVVGFSPAEIRANARRFGPSGPLLLLWFRRRYLEGVLYRSRQIRFRVRQKQGACAAYGQLDPVEFSGINLLQAWANWRTIPCNLNGRLPARPVSVLDLCSGLGESTAVLAFYCPPGSRIIGLEGSARLVEAARLRSFARQDGGTADVAFCVQDVLGMFRDPEGAPVPADSIDLVNASGAIGSHFGPDETASIAAECARVIRPGGLALLDAGRSGTRPGELSAIMADLGFVRVGRARSCVFDRHWQLCFRRPARAAEAASARE